jgi:hypothetical protein
MGKVPFVLNEFYNENMFCVIDDKLGDFLKKYMAFLIILI